MDRTKVRIFLYVIDSGSLTKAAGAFGYTTSGISHMMSAMEEEVGFPLLIRSRTGVTPTANAERLIPILRSSCIWAQTNRTFEADHLLEPCRKCEQFQK